jgi:lipoprotein-anchoring transpeptidase ErfK/SrfK
MSDSYGLGHMPQHTSPHQVAPPEDRPRTSRKPLLIGAVVGVVVILAAVIGFAALSGPPDGSPSGIAAGELAPAAGELPLSSTYTTVDGAPQDNAVDAKTSGIVVHPIRETPVHDAPNGRAIARMESTQIGDTWLPVIGEDQGWVQVLLPSKPNGSTGWLRSQDVERANTPYLINVHLESKKLELLRNDKVVGEWTVGIGKESAPTPAGRTFLLGAFKDAKQTYSPVILPLGTHSPTHDTFGGGPGTVAIHTWPTDDVYGTETSDGCIRVPPDALDQLTGVPLGTLVMINED